MLKSQNGVSTDHHFGCERQRGLETRLVVEAIAGLLLYLVLRLRRIRSTMGSEDENVSVQKFEPHTKLLVQSVLNICP